MRLISITLTSLCLCLLAGAATAQTSATSTAGVQVDRGSDELRDAVDIRPDEDRDFIDTAMVFTNISDQRAAVRCVARNGNGGIVGSAWALVPRHGLRFILASDIGDGADFVGHVSCGTNGRVVGSAFLLGPSGVTDLPSRRIGFDGPVGVAFPVVVTR